MTRLKSALRLCSLELRIAPAVFNVTNLNESGAGSIRQAVIDANNNPGNDDIEVQAGLTGAVILTSGPITITDPVSIFSSGTRSASLFGIATNYNGRVFIVNAATSLTGIACSQSNATGLFSGLGGGIYSTADLTLTECGFGGDTASSGGAIYQTGPTLTLNRCSFSADQAPLGAAVYSTGAVSVEYCQFDSCVSNNSNSGGGGVYLANGSLSLESSSFRGCGSTNLNFGKGGAVYANGTFFAQNCTFASCGGGQGGGLYLTSGGTLWNCTVAYNVAGTSGSGTGGGIYGDVILESTIVSNNNATNGPDIFGAVTAKYCALGSSSGFTIYTDQGNNLAFGQDLQVEQGSSGHGGLTPAAAIQYTSPCKDKGSNPGNFAYDTRGSYFPRTVGTAPDIGAFEVQPPPKVSIQINSDGSAQRSRITAIFVSFDTQDILPLVGTNWQIKRTSDNALVTIGGGGPGGPNNPEWRTYSLGFKSGPVENKSLADGVYTLTLFSATWIDGAGQHLDGNGDGIGGDDYVSPTTPGNPNRIFRLFGDADGNGIVDGMDFAAFRISFNTNDLTFDFDGNGVVDGLDFGQFRQRFGMVI